MVDLPWPILLVAYSILSLVLTAPILEEVCPNDDHYTRRRHEGNRSAGRYQLPFQRPVKRCRNFYSHEVEEAIERLRSKIADPDLFRLFDNAHPNTMETIVKWKGFAHERDEDAILDETDEDLALVITGDINAIWLRDSANQILSYAPVLTASEDPNLLAALFRGMINAHARYIKYLPYCHAYQPFKESGIPTEVNGAYNINKVKPPCNGDKSFDCKRELDDLVPFLQLSLEYYNATQDMGQFSKYGWLDTAEVILDAADGMRVGTYSDAGKLVQPGYTMVGQTSRATETTSNEGHGNPVTGFTGMVRSTFRPSDDGTIFPFPIPSNMMFAASLQKALSNSIAMNTERTDQLALRMLSMAGEIPAGIAQYGVIPNPEFGAMFSYEVDGYGSQKLMDDATLPSLLSAPLTGYANAREVYLKRRRFALGPRNPYRCQGPVFSGIGDPHWGPTKGWWLSSMVRVMTSQDGSGNEARQEIRALLGSTDGLGLLDERASMRTWKRIGRDSLFRWFGRATGRFGQMILQLERKRPALLGESYP